MSHPEEFSRPRGITHEGRSGTPNPTRSSSSGSSTGTVQVDPKTILVALRDNWKWALPTGIFLAAAAAAAIFQWWRPQYEASAMIQIQHNVPYIAFEPSETGQRSSERFVQTQVELLRSALVLEPVVADPEIAAIPEIARQFDAVDWLSESLTIRGIGKSELFLVKFTSASPRDAAMIVNAVVDEYLKLHQEDQTSRNKRVIDLLEEEKTAREGLLVKQRQELRQMVEEATEEGNYQLATFEAGDASPMSRLNDVLAQQTAAEVEMEVLDAQVNAMDGEFAAEKHVSELDVARRTEADPEAQRMKSQIAYLSAQLHEMESIIADKSRSREYRRVADKITLLKASLEKYMISRQQEVRKQLLEEALRKHEEQLAEKRSELEGRRMMVDLLKKRAKKELEQLSQSNDGGLKIEFKRAELAQAESVLDKISSRIVALRTESRAPNRITMRQRARVPSQPVAAYPVKELGVATAGCMMLPFGVAVLLEVVRRRVRSVENLREISHLPVLGEISQLPSRQIHGRREGSSRSTYLFEESFNALRTKLILSEEWKDARIFAVTSAVNNEGKTSVCSQLAMSTARSRDVKVLLVDCDTRLPDLHKFFDGSLSPGLTDVLRGDMSPEDGITHTSLENFDVLCAGELKESPHTLFSEESLERFLKWASDNYEYIFLDTPPILAAAESLVMAKLADASLVCAMLNVSRSDQIEEACERLTMVGSPSLGAVLNGVPFRSYTTRYGEYGYYETVKEA